VSGLEGTGPAQGTVFPTVLTELDHRRVAHMLSLTGSQVTGQLEGEKESGLEDTGHKIYKSLN